MDLRNSRPPNAASTSPTRPTIGNGSDHRERNQGAAARHDDHRSERRGAIRLVRTPDVDPGTVKVATRQTLHPQAVKRRLVFADLAALMFGVLLAIGIQWWLWPVSSTTVSRQVLLCFASMPVWLALAIATGLYASRANARWAEESRHIFTTALMWVAGLAGLAFTIKFDELSRRWVAALFVSVVVVQLTERRVARAKFRRLRQAGRLSRPILIAGTDENAFDLAARLQANPDLGYDALGFVGEVPHRPSPTTLPLLGDFSYVEDVAAEVGATGVMISLYSIDGPTVNVLTRRLTDAGLHVTLCSSLRDIDLQRLRFQQIDGQMLVYIEPTIRTGWRRRAKRVFDLSISALGLVLTAPIMLSATIAIRLESYGPVVFRQQRVGENGQLFEIFKLRTMVVGADDMKSELLEHNETDGPMFKMRSDPRVTKVGRVLRKFSIDELPQFWNVVRGEMSVVGPRPALPSEVAQWDDDVHERLRVLPGVTGMWQVSGRSEASFEQYKRLDLYYVDNWSLAHDIRIVCRTVGVVVNRRGAC